MSFSGNCMELEVMLNEVRQSYKENYHILSYMWNLRIKNKEMKVKGIWKGKRGGTEGIRESNREGEYDQSILYICIEMS
jgi:hypothetical protein